MIPLLAFAILIPQNLKDTYGKTDAQILAMGHDAWAKFYEAKAGDSTVAMSDTEGLYADALARRNDALLAKRSDQKGLAAMRKALRAFAGDAVAVGMAGTGGGTMWNPIAAAYYGDAETTFYRMLAPGKAAPHRVASDVTKELTLLRRSVKGADLMPEDRAKVGPAIARLSGDGQTVDALASTLDRRKSDLALEFCRSTLRDVRKTVGPN